jgi:hypothetical protein
LTIQSALIFMAILAIGMGIPSCFDAVVPLGFDDPGWSEFLSDRPKWAEANANLPHGGFERLCRATLKVEQTQEAKK